MRNYRPSRHWRPAAEMVSAANEFIGGLGQDAALRGLALMDFDAREHFKFTPGERPGVPLRDLNEGQRAMALALVSTGLSENGLTKAEVTRQNELVLRAQENSDARDPLGYFWPSTARRRRPARGLGTGKDTTSPFTSPS